MKTDTITPSGHTADVLIAARKLIEKPENWTQGNYATTADGNAIGPREANATCFCSLGACIAAAGGYMLSTAVENVLEPVMGDDIVTFNDSHTHAEVIEAFDRAIFIAKSQPLTSGDVS